MIERVLLQNFKAVGQEAMDLELAPLTLLVGPNGSGKSSILEAIGVLAETAGRNSYEPVVQGERVSFPSVDLVFHQRDMHRELCAGIWIRGDRGDAPALGYELRASRSRDAAARWCFSQSLLERDADGGQRVIAHKRSEWLDASGAVDTHLEFDGGRWRGRPFAADLLLDRRTFEPQSTPEAPAAQTDSRRAEQAMERLIGYLTRRVVFLTGIRGADLFVREVGPAVVRTGRFGEQTIRLINIVQAAAKQREAWSRIVAWAERFGMRGLTGGWVGQNEIAVSFLDPATGTQLPLTSAAGGSQRLLPLLVDSFAFAGEASRTVLIDEIEESAHPEWQLAIGELLAEVVREGRQVIATTHSPTMVLAVCAAVAKGLLGPKQVAIHHMERNGSASATRLRLTASGSISGGWIRSFAKVEQQLLERFLIGQDKDESRAVGTAERGRRGGGHGRVSDALADAAPPSPPRKRGAKRSRPPGR